MDGPEGEILHSSNTPDPGAPTGTAETGPEADGLQRPGPTSGYNGEEWHSPRGPDLAVHPIKNQGKEVDPVQDQDAHVYDDGPGNNKKPTLAASGGPSTRKSPQVVDCNLSSEFVANCRHPDEVPLPEGIPIGFEDQRHDHSPVIAADRSRLAQIVTSWVMQNPANRCYVNSSMIAMVWANLHRLHFSFDDWGVLQEGLKAMMQCGDFQDHLAAWDGIRQHDAAEFTTFLMSKMDSAAVHCIWERRFARETGAVKRHAHAMGAMLLHLRVMPEPVHSLRQLVENWHTESGMITAFSHLPSLICIHLDRLRPMAGTIHGQKLMSRVLIDAMFRIPKFTGDDTRIEHHEFVPIAALAHLGRPGEGHYRAALKCLDASTPTEWLLSDDDTSVVPALSLPGWFETQVMMVWALRKTDLCSLLVSFENPPVVPAIDQTLALFAD